VCVCVWVCGVLFLNLIYAQKCGQWWPVVTGGMLNGIQENGTGSGTTRRRLTAWSLRRQSELSHVGTQP
jgi:hypothetical protein